MRRSALLLGLALFACGRSVPSQRETRAPVFILPAVLPGATLGEAYEAQLQAEGEGPWSWALVGDLPPGLAFLGNDATASISGVPLLEGDFPFEVHLTGYGAALAIARYTLSVSGPQGPLTIVTPGLPDADVGAPYEATVECTGGAAPFQWSVTMGALPGGLELISEGRTARIRGLPRQRQNVVVWITVEDADGARDDQSYSLRVRGNEGPLRINGGGPLPPTQRGANYQFAIFGMGGVQPYAWAVVTGSLPPGLTLETLGTPNTLLHGQAERNGEYAFEIELFDDLGNTTRESFSLSVRDPDPFEILTASLPDGVVDELYNTRVQATPGFDPYIWSISAGALPPGVQLQIDNQDSIQILGNPTLAGSFSFTIRVEAVDGRVARRSFQIEIAAEPALRIVTTSVPSAVVGEAYEAMVFAADGAQPYTWAQNGALPPGLQLEAIGTPSTRIHGTPQTTGTFTFEILAIDRNARRARRDFTITVSPPIVPLSIPTTSVPSGAVCTDYLGFLEAVGGTNGGYQWSITQGSLPPGVTLGASGERVGLIGVPDSAGTYTFTVTVIDAGGATASRTYSATIAPGDTTKFGILVGREGSIGTVYPLDLCSATPLQGASLVNASAGQSGASTVLDASEMSPDGRYFAYAAVQAGGTGVYLVDLDGALPTQSLLFPLETVSGVQVVWAPDSTRLAIRGRTGVPVGGYTIHVVDVVGGAPVRVDAGSGTTMGPLGDIVWSPNSQRLAHMGDQLTDNIIELFVTDFAAGTAMTRPVSGFVTGNADVISASTPVWSSDSNHVFFVGNAFRGNRREYFWVDVRPTTAFPQPLVPLAGDFTTVVGSAAVAPDGSAFVYFADQESSTRDEVYHVDLATPPFAVTKISGAPAMSQRISAPVWSPASNRIAFGVQRSTGGAYELNVVSTSALTSPVRVDHGAMFNRGVRTLADSYLFNHDGTKIVFLLDPVSFRFEPFVVDLAGAAPSAPIVVGQHAAGNNTRKMVWARSSNHLLTVTEPPNNGARALYSADLSGTGGGLSVRVSPMSGVVQIAAGQLVPSPGGARAFYTYSLPTVPNAVVGLTAGPTLGMAQFVAPPNVRAFFYAMPW